MKRWKGPSSWMWTPYGFTEAEGVAGTGRTGPAKAVECDTAGAEGTAVLGVLDDSAELLGLGRALAEGLLIEEEETDRALSLAEPPLHPVNASVTAAAPMSALSRCTCSDPAFVSWRISGHLALPRIGRSTRSGSFENMHGIRPKSAYDPPDSRRDRSRFQPNWSGRDGQRREAHCDQLA